MGRRPRRASQPSAGKPAGIFRAKPADILLRTFSLTLPVAGRELPREVTVNWQKIKTTIKEHIWGPVGSAVFHVLIIIVLIKFATHSGEMQMAAQQEVILDTVETKTPLEERQMDKEIKPPDQQQDLSTLPTDIPTIGADDSMVGESVAGNDRGPADLGFGGREGSTAFGLDMASTIKSPLILKGIAKGYGGRFGAGGKGKGGRRPPGVDDAILKALRWLKAHQRGDGGWGYGGNPEGTSGNNDVAVSGLALLCFLGYGKTTSDAEFGPTVEKAISFLKAKQNAEGYFCPVKAENAFQQYPYIHSMAAYAVSEAYGMTRIPDLQPVMDKAAQIIIAGQQKETGGWDYQYAKAARRDTSVGAWQVQALKAALIAGCTVPGLKEALDNSIRDFKKMLDPKTGHFGYEKPGDRGNQYLGMTAASVLCLQFVGHGKDPETMAGLRSMKEAKIAWENGGGEMFPLYAFYYITQCRFQESPQSFDAWKNKFVPIYLKAQDPDGHWPAMGGGQNWGDEGKLGPVYTTTLCCLTLETFVRFLPTYQHVEDVSAPTTAPDDVVVKVL